LSSAALLFALGLWAGGWRAGCGVWLIEDESDQHLNFNVKK
jgi:hypothetical protein